MSVECGPAAARALTDWLVRDGRLLPDASVLLGEFCERSIAAGLPLDRASLQLRALHARYRGVARIWEPGKSIDERYLDHGVEKTAMYLESPMRAAVESNRRLDWRLDHGRALPFGLLEELREQGFTHYTIAPVTYSVGLVNAVALATRYPGGFTPADLIFFDSVLPAFSAVVELKAMRRFIENMLNTYVGQEPTRLILDGQVRRGDVRTITAALMLVDLRDFTLLSDRMGPRDVIRLLNEYFDCVFPPVYRHHGEIMEIMGDGVLAIFHPPPGASETEACRAALAAAQEALAAVTARNRREQPGAPILQAGIALHYGTASYGNIGSGDRLDFTVIGPDVNLTSRIERFCRELDRPLIMSEAFAATLGRPVWEIGHFELRGFSRLQRLFELPPEDWAG
ncbi:MAG TPA: adenylate/guanylate cyclase domain-containing protein [Stellaceae bacterium]|jgi:adenylate cyclase|nr:adenylate/guanylate cyclase domain-containing protein [Stellaceae bacterium]